jgi:hypothetical protein
VAADAVAGRWRAGGGRRGARGQAGGNCARACAASARKVVAGGQRAARGGAGRRGARLLVGIVEKNGLRFDETERPAERAEADDGEDVGHVEQDQSVALHAAGVLGRRSCPPRAAARRPAQPADSRRADRGPLRPRSDRATARERERARRRSGCARRRRVSWGSSGGAGRRAGKWGGFEPFERVWWHRPRRGSLGRRGGRGASSSGPRGRPRSPGGTRHGGRRRTQPSARPCPAPRRR